MSAKSKGLKRREFLAGTAGTVTLASCGRRSRASIPLVSISRAAGYGQELYGVVRRILTEHKVDARGKHVVLKPNLVEFDSATCINTSPMLVHAAYEAFLAQGAASVSIAEGPGHRRDTLSLAEAAGYFQQIPKFEEHFTDLNLDDVQRVGWERPFSKIDQPYLPRTALGADLLVSLPKMKTHHWVGATLSMKNFFGLVPGAVYGWPKNVLHWAGINECIADLYNSFTRTFAIVDGIVGMEGNGPIQGTPKTAGVVVAGADLAAVDAACCRIMEIDPAKVRYLQLVEAPQPEVIGEKVSSVRTPFALIPEFAAIRLRRT